MSPGTNTQHSTRLQRLQTRCNFPHVQRIVPLEIRQQHREKQVYNLSSSSPQLSHLSAMRLPCAFLAVAWIFWPVDQCPIPTVTGPVSLFSTVASFSSLHPPFFPEDCTIRSSQQHRELQPNTLSSLPLQLYRFSAQRLTCALSAATGFLVRDQCATFHWHRSIVVLRQQFHHTCCFFPPVQRIVLV